MSKINKSIAIGLSLLLALSATPAFAASTGSVADDINQLTDNEYTIVGQDTVQNKQSEYEEKSISDSQTSNTDVYLQIDTSGVKATVPTVVIINGTKNAQNKYRGDYSVNARGDITGTQKLTVVPEADTFQMSQNGTSTTYPVTISQSKTTFNSTDLAANNGAGTTTTGTIAATDLRAGSWQGEFNMLITLEEMTQEELFMAQGYRLFYDINLSATSNDDVHGYYLVPTENTQELASGSSSQNKGLLSKVRRIFEVEAIAAENETIVKDGIEYTLSDDDKLVVQGEGAMTDDVLNKLNDMNGLASGIITALKESDVVSSIGYSVTGTKVRFYDTSASYGECIRYDISTDAFDTYGSTKYGSVFTKCIKVSREEFETAVRNAYNELEVLYIHTLPKTLEIKNGIKAVRGFSNVGSIENIIIEDGITSIGSSAFYHCTSLTDITIPNSVTTLGPQAFAGCTGLTSIVVPSSVTTLEVGVFQGCTGLTSITIPDSITSIPQDGFRECTGLTSITIGSGLTSMGTDVFYGCTGLNNITVSQNNIKYDSRNNCNAIIDTASNTLIVGCKNTTIPDDVTSIQSLAFYKCTGLTSIDIPDSVTSIGLSAFNFCSNLTSIRIPSSVTTIEMQALKNIAQNSTIYCETQAVANLLQSEGGNFNYDSSKTTVVVDPTQFE